ncbi:MAG: RNase H family protein [Anaerolineae bacterium]
MFQVTLYTDGSCLGNPGPGGYAAVLSCNGRFKEITGSSDHTTNNRMELQAVITGLKALKRRCQVTIVTDSQYVVTILNNGRAKVNLNLVQQVRQLSRRHGIIVQQVRGHSGHEMNERCDQLATAEANQRKQTIACSREVVQCAA